MRLSLLIRAFTLLTLLAAGNILLAQSRQPDNRPRNCSISGRVTVGGNPLQNKIVIASEASDRSSLSAGDISVSFDSLSPPAYSARTDADGRYRIIGLSAGKYQVHPQASAYMPEKNSGLSFQTITLEDNESEENVNFALVRGGVITGRITGAEGHPLIEQRIELTLVGEEGQKYPHSGYLNNELNGTDDRGVYRLYGIQAGRYLVSISGGRFTFSGQMTSKYPRTFHPDTTEEAQARIIEITNGGEVTDVDIRLGAARKGFEVAGRVIDAESGQPLPQIALICLTTGSKDGVIPSFTGTAKSDEKGAFRFNGLQPGQYVLQMTALFAGLTGAQSEHFAEELKFEVTTSDVGGLELRARRGASISGVAVVEAAPEQKGKTGLGQLMLSAMVSPAGENSDEASVASMMSGMGMVKLNSDGSFRITGLSPGKALLRPFGIGGSVPVVKRIERNGVEIREGIEVKAGEAVTGVKLVLAYASGVIRGQVNVTGGQLPAGWRMMARAGRAGTLPTEEGGFAEVDGKGRFVIEGLLDGEYEVSVQTISTNHDSGKFAPVSQTVRVANGAEAHVTLKLDLGKKQEE